MRITHVGTSSCPVTPLPNQVTSVVPGKAMGNSPSLGPRPLMQKTQMESVPASFYPSVGKCGLLEDRSAHGRFVLFVLAVSFPYLSLSFTVSLSFK